MGHDRGGKSGQLAQLVLRSARAESSGGVGQAGAEDHGHVVGSGAAEGGELRRRLIGKIEGVERGPGDVGQLSTPRMSPLVGTPVPAVTSTWLTSGTWLTDVPRTWRTPSAMPFIPCR